jgi:hypothetical protein
VLAKLKSGLASAATLAEEVAEAMSAATLEAAGGPLSRLCCVECLDWCAA